MPSIQYSWDAPATDSQFGPADHYLWQHRKVGDPWTRPTQVNGTSITIPNLERNTEYEFRVKAVNFVGESADVSTTVMTTSDLPAAVRPPNPTNIEVAEADAELTVSWTDPGDTGTDFSVRYRRGTSGDWTTVTGIAQPEHTIIDLTNGQRYTLQVRSENYAGASDWSATQTATPNVPFLPPGKILYLEIEAFQASLRVSFDAPDDGLSSGNAALTYELQYRLFSDSEWIDLSVPSNRVVNVTEVATESTYAFRARATNAVGSGPWSDIFTGTPTEASRPQISFSDTPMRSSGVTFTQDRDGVWHGLTEDDTQSLGLSFVQTPRPTSGRSIQLVLNHISGPVSRLDRWDEITGLRFTGRVGRNSTTSLFPNINGQFRFGESDAGGYEEEDSVFEFVLLQLDSYYVKRPDVLRFSVADNGRFKPVPRGFLSYIDTGGDGVVGTEWSYDSTTVRNIVNDRDDFKVPILGEDWERSADGYDRLITPGSDIPASAWRIDFLEDWYIEVEIRQASFFDGSSTVGASTRWVYARITEEQGLAGVSSVRIMDPESTLFGYGGVLLRCTRSDDGTTYDLLVARGYRTRNDFTSDVTLHYRTYAEYGPHLSVGRTSVFNNKSRTGISLDFSFSYVSAQDLLAGLSTGGIGISRAATGAWTRRGQLVAPSGTEAGGRWDYGTLAEGRSPSDSELAIGGAFFDRATGNVWHWPRRDRFKSIAYNALTDYGFGGSRTWRIHTSSRGPGLNSGSPGDWSLRLLYNGSVTFESLDVYSKGDAQTRQEALDLYDTHTPIGYVITFGTYADGDEDSLQTRATITRTA